MLGEIGETALLVPDTALLSARELGLGRAMTCFASGKTRADMSLASYFQFSTTAMIPCPLAQLDTSSR